MDSKLEELLGSLVHYCRRHEGVIGESLIDRRDKISHHARFDDISDPPFSEALMDEISILMDGQEY